MVRRHRCGRCRRCPLCFASVMVCSCCFCRIPYSLDRNSKSKCVFVCEKAIEGEERTEKIQSMNKNLESRNVCWQLDRVPCMCDFHMMKWTRRNKISILLNIVQIRYVLYTLLWSLFVCHVNAILYCIIHFPFFVLLLFIVKQTQTQCENI